MLHETSPRGGFFVRKETLVHIQLSLLARSVAREFRFSGIKKASPKGGLFRVLSNKINALYQRRKTQLLLFVLLMQPRGVMLAHGRESDAGFRLEDFGAKHRAPMRGSVRFAVILRVRGDDAGNLIRLFSE